jgi:hypothetical protein
VFVASSRARLRLNSGRFFAGLDSGRPLFLHLLFLFFSLTKDLLFLFFSLTNLAYSRVNHVFFRDFVLDGLFLWRDLLRVFIRLERPARPAGFRRGSGTYLPSSSVFALSFLELPAALSSL